MTTEQSLQTYNAFGLISVSARKITASITAVAAGRSTTRSVIRELDQVSGVAEDEQLASDFGAWIEPGQKARITVHEIGKLRSGKLVSEIPEVGKVLNEAIDLLRASLNI